MRFIIGMLAFLLCSVTYAQVGIGTITPEATSLLDVSSETKGFLAPRMTTAQRNAITTPANSLMVYDTDLKSFYYYDTTTSSWIKINSAASDRDNFVLVKDVSDFPAPSGGVITLDENTYYEINGTITLTNPINLNNAYVSGLDADEDVLSSAGTVFSGSTGGSIRNITITGGGTAFNITGGVSLLVQNTIIANMGSVGTISNLNLYFADIIQFVGNTNGIIYNNIGELLLSSQAWFGNNTGTFETLTGTFTDIQKTSGFSNVPSGSEAFNVTGITSITGGAVLNGIVFSGEGTRVAGSSPYPGFNFSNDWTVDCPGIPKESDGEAIGNIYLTTSGTTNFISSGATGRRKLVMTTAPTEMFRATSNDNNRITYMGKKTRKFNMQASFSVDAPTNNKNFTFFIAKNGTALTPTAISTKVVGGGDVRALSFTATTTLAPGDYVEIWAQNDSDTSGITISACNFLIN